jgi:protein-tyrosine phosphatase
MFNKISAVTLAIVLAGSACARAEVTDLSCDQTGPTAYKLSYTLTGDSHKVQIFAGVDPTGAKGKELVLTTSDTNVTVHAGASGQRVYFFIKPDHGSEREVSIRHIPLQGTPNFRDLGGYETTDGHFVRWGLIYRSGVLSKLTASDFAYLRQLDVRVICDFRTAEENAVAPEIWIPGSDVIHVSDPIGTAGAKDVSTPMNQFLSTNPTPEQTKAWLAKMYGDFAVTNAPQYAEVFARLKQDHLPLLFHCTAGKDRTGVFSALLLLTLGVPEKTVLADYELTDKYMLNAMSPAATQKMLASSSPNLARVPPVVMRAMMAADPDYLRGTLHTIDKKFGSFDKYRRSELGVSDADVQVLKARLLER